MYFTLWAFSPSMSCIVHDWGTLGVVWQIQVLDWLQVDNFFYNWFVDLDNQFEVVVSHLLIGEMIDLGYRDGFHGECISVYGNTLDMTYNEL